MRSESRESMLLSNDNEQYSRRNNLRFLGLKPVMPGEDCRMTASKFITSILHVTNVSMEDIEAAHMTTSVNDNDWSTETSDDVSTLL